MSSLACSYLGLQDYATARLYQEGLARRVAAGTYAGGMLFLEHPAQFTIGRHSVLPGEVEARLAASGTPVSRTNRGGDLTWHGPGQLVVYPVLPLRAAGRGVRAFVEGMTRGLQEGLRLEGVETWCQAGAPGLFVDGPPASRKIASIGLAVQRGVTLHGASVNLDSRATEGFMGLAPCGLAGVVATSVENERGGEAPNPEGFARRLAPLLADRLDFSAATFVPPPGMES